MPNIMLTYRCNLSCPYCFANEFVNRKNSDISEEDFRQAAEFISAVPGMQIGLIGGEPTIHPKLPQFIKLLVQNRNVNTIMVYTNGIYMDALLKLTQDAGVGAMLKILVNCNSPEVMGKHNFEQLKDSLDMAFGVYRAGRQIKFGLNLYDNEFDYSFIKELLLRYDQHQLRISLTVPNFSVCGQVNPVENFKGRKAYLLNFFKEMDEIGVMSYYDCNKPPQCIWTEEELAWLYWYQNKYRSVASNLVDVNAKCDPVVDILPDLRAVRCFGMSDFDKVRIDDFHSIVDLQNYFRNRVDAEAFRLSSASDCTECYDRFTSHCMGGCLGYKQNQIKKMNEYLGKVD